MISFLIVIVLLRFVKDKFKYQTSQRQGNHYKFSEYVGLAFFEEASVPMGFHELFSFKPEEIRLPLVNQQCIEYFF